MILFSTKLAPAFRYALPVKQFLDTSVYLREIFTCQVENRTQTYVLHIITDIQTTLKS